MLKYKVNKLSLTNLIKKILSALTLILMLILSQNVNVVAGEQEDKITKLLMDMFNQPNNPLKINPIVVENDYAIAGWSQGDKGGRALLTNTNNKWTIQLCAGDALKDANFLKDSGVDSKIIPTILKKLATAEAKLDVMTLKRFSEFKEIVYINAGQSHQAHGHGKGHGQGHGHGGGYKDYAMLHFNAFFDKVHNTEKNQPTGSYAVDGEINDAYTHSHFGIGKSLTDNIFLKSVIMLHGGKAGNNIMSHGGSPKVISNGTDEDKFFSATPLTVEQLNLNYHFNDDKMNIYVGKFNPEVGVNLFTFPGMYGWMPTETIIEKVGLGFEARNNFGNLGEHSINASKFRSDRSFLSDSWIRSRGQTTSSTPALANTSGLESYAISYAGSNFVHPVLNKFSYRIGYAHQDKGTQTSYMGSSAQDEERYSAALMYRQDLTPDTKLNLVAEKMRIDNYGSKFNFDKYQNNFGVSINHKNWEIASTYARIIHMSPDAWHKDLGNVFAASIGYQINDQIMIRAGCQNSDTYGYVNDRCGMQFSYANDFLK
jgi:hypothetical protein